MFSKRIVTLNIEASSVRVLVTKGRRVERWGSISLPMGFIRDGLILDPENLGATIKNFLVSQEVSPKRVITSLSGLHSLSRTMTLPDISRDLLGEVILREARKIMPVDLEELYLSWQPMDLRNEERRLFLLGVPRNLLDAEIQALRMQEIDPYIMDLKPMALVRTVNRKEAMILDVESDNFDVIIVEDGIPVIMRTILLRQSVFSPAEVVENLVEEFSRTVKFYTGERSGNPLDPSTPVFLTGELAKNPSLTELVQARIDYPIESLDSPIECPPDFPIPEYAVNIGLALKKISQPKELRPSFRSVDLNILPEAYRPPRRPLGQFLLAPAILAGIAILVLLYQISTGAANETAQFRAQLQDMNQQIQLKRLNISRVSQLRQSIDETIAAAEKLEEEHRTILSRSGDFSDPLNQVSEALVPESSLTSVTDTGDAMTLKGQASSYSAVLNYAKALKQTEGFSSVDVVSLSKASGAQPGEVTFTIVVRKEKA